MRGSLPEMIEVGERPDPEVSGKPTRRRYRAAYKLQVLAEAEACTAPGEVEALLRREGLYSSYLVAWRKARKTGALGRTEPKRGRKAVHTPESREIERLRRENDQLKKRLEFAEFLVDLQKKMATMLGIDLQKPSSEGER